MPGNDTKMATSPEQKKSRTAADLPSTAATNRFAGRIAIVTGGASGEIDVACVERSASFSLQHKLVSHAILLVAALSQ